MAQDPQKSDVIIIGAGPCGLFAGSSWGSGSPSSTSNLDKPGVNAERSRKSRSTTSRRCRSAPARNWSSLMEQIKPFAPSAASWHMARRRAPRRRHVALVTTDRDAVLEAPVLVIAAGGGSFMPKRPPIAGIDGYEGQSVFYAVREMEKFRGQYLVIAGGGDSALDWTVNLAPLAKSLTLIHGRVEGARHGQQNARPGRRRGGRFGDRPDRRAGRRGPRSIGGGHQAERGRRPAPAGGHCRLAFYGLTMKLSPIADFGAQPQRST